MFIKEAIFWPSFVRIHKKRLRFYAKKKIMIFLQFILVSFFKSIRDFLMEISSNYIFQISDGMYE